MPWPACVQTVSQQHTTQINMESDGQATDLPGYLAGLLEEHSHTTADHEPSSIPGRRHLLLGETVGGAHTHLGNVGQARHALLQHLHCAWYTHYDPCDENPCCCLARCKYLWHCAWYICVDISVALACGGCLQLESSLGFRV